MTTASTWWKRERKSGHHRWLVRVLAVVGLVAGGMSIGGPANAALAGVGMSVTPLFPPQVSVGQQNVAVGLFINNASFGVGPVTLTSITLNPSCKDTTPGTCTQPDLGVFSLSATGSGASATDACAGKTFTIIGPDANGNYQFIPDSPVILQPTGAMQSCTIAFTVNVLKAPTADADPGAAGIQTRQFATVSGFATTTDPNTPPSILNGTGTGTSITTIKASPAMTTLVSGATVVIGTPITDTATISGLAFPTGSGTITFNAYGPNDATCTGTVAFTSTVTVNAGNGNYTSAPFTPTATGTYRWIASFSGDLNNNAVTTACNDANETVVVSSATPAITTQVSSATVTVGTPFTDTATISGLVSPTNTGTITFNLYGPNNSTCTGAPVFTSTVTVNAGNGNYTSAPFTPSSPGTYRFTASYSGDSNNNAVATACNDLNENVVVNKATPAITTLVSAPTVVVGTAFNDTATISGLVNPTNSGTITFNLFAPGDTNCLGTPVFTSTVTVNAGNGNYSSAQFTPNATGTYRWVASYSGDANNNPVSTLCNDAGEVVVVSAASPTITTQVNPATVVVGNPFTDTATLAGLISPTNTGTITFNLYGPNNATCTGTPVFTSTVPVDHGNGNYTSGAFTPTLAGTYRFIASYSGDANNNPAANACGDATETVVANSASPTIVTQASAPVTIGSPISDTATLAGGVNPTGTITFTIFGPNNATCTGTPISTTTVPVNHGNGNYASATFTPTTAGTYRFIAAYGGDANNNAVSTACNDANESVVVSPASPALTTQVSSATITVGGTVSDTANLTGLVNPTGTGTIVFNLYGPNNATCTGTPAFTSTTTGIDHNGAYTSSTFTLATAGTYRFVATFSGDANNNPAFNACGDAPEVVVVNKATPAVTTQASASTVVIGTPFSDTATISGLVNPTNTGTITFNLYAPADTSCLGTPIFTSTVTVNAGNGNYTSAPFTPTATGTYRWVASYSGDVNNNPAANTCGDAAEVVVVQSATPTITTQVSPSTVVVGNPFSDTATLSGLVNPTANGTITFNLYGPNDATCTGAVVFTSTVPVDHGNGNYASGSFTPTLAGTYRYIASYSGDANNKPAANTCGDATETVVANKASPAITTQISAPVTVGGSISDTANLSGAVSPTGTITFTFFGPNNATCAGTPVFTSTVPVNHGNGAYTSASFAPATAGTYRSIAAYSGDANNNGVTTLCNDSNESVVVAQGTPAITTQVSSATVTVGSPFTDTATISGLAGATPGGSITFNLYGPNDASCSTTPVFTSTVAVTHGNGNYQSGAFTPTGTGTYRFIASYSGDANNAAASNACSDASEVVVVNQASPTIVTQVSAGTVTVGAPFTDTATLSGGVNPTGTITFNLYGPNNATCTGTPVFTSTVTVNAGNGNYTSGSFTPTATGTYRFIASYSGDANNVAAANTCGDASEVVVVNKASPAIVTQVSAANVVVGSPFHDTATVSGLVAPTNTATITFTLFGPNNATCTGTPVFTSTVTVNAGNGAYPSASFTPTATGTYRFIAAYSGDANNNAATTACNDANEVTVVNSATPAIVTQVSAATSPVGSPFTDTATISGLVNPTGAGTITFNLYGPNDATCTGAVVFTSTVTVNAGNGNYTSGSFTPTQTGTYRFVAAFSGDTNDNAVTSPCNAANEVVVVNSVTPTLTTQMSAPVTIGGQISDTANLGGGVSPTGTITFTFFGPNNATCTGTPVFSSTVPVNHGNGAYTSASFTPTTAGTYRTIAAYSGDTNNIAVTTACNDANESVVVSSASPAITTQATSGPVIIGTAISDTATLSGGFSPTGTITFRLYGPNNATCTGTPVFTATATVTGNGVYTSGPFTPTATGTYRFVASYGGDANNAAVANACLDTAEAVVVNAAGPAIVTQVSSGTVVVGTPFSDTATLSGGVNPTGSITFSLYGPNNATCTGTPAFTATVPVTGNGSYPSGLFTPTATGTYRYVASYSGDGNNGTATSACGDPAETVVVNAAGPAIATQVSNATRALGQPFTDTATISGLVNPTNTATITFRLYGPTDTTCTGTPVSTSQVTVDHGNGAYTSGPFTPTTSGTYRYVASYSGDANNNPTANACGDATEVVVVTQATPSITTHASIESTAAGTPFQDVADISGLVNPTGTGTITFRLYAPADVNCTGAPAFTSTVPVNHGNGSYTSATFTTTGKGLYRFVASFSGDANNAPTTNACGDPSETVVVASATPTLTTQISPPVPVGGAVTDTATLTGGVNATGTITFTIYGPNDASCTGTPAFSDQVTVNHGNGDYTSATFTPTAAGVYRSIAVYSGDANNNMVTTACNDAGETVVVGMASPTIVTQVAQGTVTVGTPISDTATLSGGNAPTGTITFNLYGPTDTTCSGTPVFTSSVAVSHGNGNYQSGTFTPTATGTYRFVASYSGDANNGAAANNCGDASEVVVVGTAAPAITTQVSAGTVVVGAPFTDTATLTGGVNPTGSITFRLYAPGDTACTGTPVFTSSVAVTHGNGNYTSAAYTPIASGTYRFVATYSGDANNATTHNACGDASEVVVVSSATPAIVTQVSSGTVALGVAFSDTATLSGLVNSTGTATITFRLYAPGDTTCTGTPVMVSTVAVSHGNGNYTSQAFTPNQTGIYRFVASYSGDANNVAAANTCGEASEVVVVSSAAPALTTQVSAPIQLGGQIHDTATLSGGAAPTGTITFNFYGPNNATCAGTPAFTSTVPVSGNGAYTSASFTPTTVGTYRAVATYSGDVNNAVVTTSCADQLEITTVTQSQPSTPTINTQVTGPIELGGVVRDTATLSGGTSPTGTITFNIYGPNNETCTGPPAFSSTVAVTHGNGNYTSAPFTPTAPGTYHSVASYSGDTNNVGVATACLEVTERVVVSPATPNINTQVSGPIQIGGQVTDTATLSGGVTPTGTITFNFYGPNNETCTGPPAFSSTTPVDHGNGNYTSGTFTPPAPGTYHSVASYSGDSRNAPVATACLEETESVVVSPAPITPSIAVTKTPSPVSMPVPGGTFTFTVVVTNTSTEPLTLTGLVDDVYGDLNGKGSCALGATLAANGGTYTCSFPGTFTSAVIASQTDTVTATGTDTHGQKATAIAKATVTLTAVVTTLSNTTTLPRTGREVKRAIDIGVLLILSGCVLVLAAEGTRRRRAPKAD